MSRIRTVKPEFWVSEQLASCSRDARLTFIGLWNFCDDQGVHPAKPRTLKAELYPMDDVSMGSVAAWMQELIDAGLVQVFQAGGETYWHVTGWSKHQKIERPTSKHPAPPPTFHTDASDQVSSRSHRHLGERSASSRPQLDPGRESKGVEGSREEEASPSPTSLPKGKVSRTARKTPIPAEFKVSERVAAWAESKGYGDLDLHLEAFRSKCLASGYSYMDWDEAFKNAIRSDWANLRSPGGKARAQPSRPAVQLFEGAV